MAQNIPVTPSDPWYELTVPLDDADGSSTPYTFEFRWNTIDKAWYFNLYEQDRTPIVHGVKVVLGMYLGRRSRHVFFKKGVLVAIDTSNKGREAGFDDFGTRVILRRYTVQDVIIGRVSLPPELQASGSTE